MNPARLPILIAGLLIAGCAAPTQNDRASVAIEQVQQHTDAASGHVDTALELNAKVQADLATLRKLKPEGKK